MTGLFDLLMFISAVYLSARIVALVGRSALDEDPFPVAEGGKRLSWSRLKALIRYLYHEDFAILVIAAGFTFLVLGKYFGFVVVSRGNYYIDFLALVSLLYCVQIYMVEDMGLEGYREGKEE